MASGHAELGDVATLLVSELVTNALLHARTVVEVRTIVQASVLRVEVCDQSANLPLRRHFDRDAATGRGLDLVEAMASSWGIETTPSGKLVWFELALTGDDGESSAGAQASDAAVARHPSAGGTPGASAEAGADTVEVRLLGVPVVVYQAHQQHTQALQREFALIDIGGPGAYVPERLMELSSMVQALFARQINSVRRQVQTAFDRGDGLVDVTTRLPPTAAAGAAELAQLLDEADGFCEQGLMLTSPTPPHVAEFRRWYLGQIVAQVGGSPPSHWRPAT